MTEEYKILDLRLPFEQRYGAVEIERFPHLRKVIIYVKEHDGVPLHVFADAVRPLGNVLVNEAEAFIELVFTLPLDDTAQ